MILRVPVPVLINQEAAPIVQVWRILMTLTIQNGLILQTAVLVILIVVPKVVRTIIMKLLKE